MAIGKEVSLDELNAQSKEELLRLVETDEKQSDAERQQELSVAERMMRRAEGNTFNLTFVDVKNDDEITLEFRLLYSGERRELLELIQNIQGIQGEESADVGKLNDSFDELKALVKQVTVTPGMDEYYDSEMCQDGDIFEIAMSVMGRTVKTVEQAKGFR